MYNYVIWGNSMADATGGAVQLAKDFDTARGYKSVTSTLIYGVQWDAIMSWIDPNYKTGNCAEDSFVRDSTGRGNYDEDENTNPWRDSLTVTGASEKYAVKNIYDLAGNVDEWTMESLENYRVSRGSNFDLSGAMYPASSRRTDSVSYVSRTFSFRVALYL